MIGLNAYVYSFARGLGNEKIPTSGREHYTTNESETKNMENSTRNYNFNLTEAQM